MRWAAMLFLLSSMPLWIGCSKGEPIVVTVREPVAMRTPETLRSCAPAPDVPDRPRAPLDVAVFVTRLAAAGEDCRRTLAERNAWEDEAAARLEASD